MSAQQIEELFVATVCVVLGVLLVARVQAVEPIAARFGRFRKWLGPFAIVVGGALAIGAVVR